MRRHACCALPVWSLSRRCRSVRYTGCCVPWSASSGCRFLRRVRCGSRSGLKTVHRSSRSWSGWRPCQLLRTLQAFAAIVRSEVRLIAALNNEIDALGEVVGEHFGFHPDAKIYASQPGLGVILGARVLSEFGDDPDRYATAKARKNYAGTSPITRASGIKKTVLARHARNDRLGDAVHQWALGALRGSPGARAYYDAMRARNIGHHAALRQLGNRPVGILHGCLKTRTRYDENTAWAHHTTAAA
jgi:Transposase IS116/IS110/IS902 family